MRGFNPCCRGYRSSTCLSRAVASAAGGCINRCCRGYRSSTASRADRAGHSFTFQSLLSWIPLLNTMTTLTYDGFEMFQSLLSWIPLLNTRLVRRAWKLLEVSILVVVDTAPQHPGAPRPPHRLQVS